MLYGGRRLSGKLGFLIQNYGLTVNQDNYIIVYEVFASNQLPEVQVLVQGESKG